MILDVKIIYPDPVTHSKYLSLHGEVPGQSSPLRNEVEIVSGEFRHPVHSRFGAVSLAVLPIIGTGQGAVKPSR